MFNISEKIILLPSQHKQIVVDMPAENKICIVTIDFVAIQFRKVFIGVGFKLWQMSNSSDTNNNKAVLNEEKLAPVTQETLSGIVRW